MRALRRDAGAQSRAGEVSQAALDARAGLERRQPPRDEGDSRRVSQKLAGIFGMTGRARRGPRSIQARLVDVSERRLTERLKDEFVATVSHELRTPLTSIAGSLGLLIGQWARGHHGVRVELDTLAIVARELNTIADVVSAESVEHARRALATDRIDLAIVDTQLGSESGLDLLPELRDGSGNIIPAIIFSNSSPKPSAGDHGESAWSGMTSSLKCLSSAVRDRMGLLSALPEKQVA